MPTLRVYIKAEICIEVKCNFAKPICDLMTEGNSMKGGHLHIGLFNKVYEQSTLTRPVEKPFSHINARESCIRGRVLVTLDRITRA